MPGQEGEEYTEEEINEVVEEDAENEGGDMSIQSDNIQEDSQEQSENESAAEDQKESASKKLLRMQLSTHTLHKLLKEGKMEKLPTGSFRISADALKELKQDDNNDEEGAAAKKRKYSSADDSEFEEVRKPKVIKTAKVTKKDTPQKNKISPKGKKKIQKKTAEEDEDEINEEIPEETCEENIKTRKVQKFHDYLSDFNSSEDEDEEMINNLKDSIAELAPRKRGNMSKPVNLLFEELHKSIFGKLSEDSDGEIDDLFEEEDVKSLPLKEPDFNEVDKPSTIPEEFCMVGRIGNDGKTKMCIRSTDKRKVFDGKQYPVYNIDTGVGSVTTVTPLTVTVLRSSDKAGAKNRDGAAHLADPDLVESLQRKSVTLRKYKEQVKVLRGRYLKLARLVASRPQLQTIGDLVSASSKFLTQDQLLFFTMQLKTGCDATQGARFSTREKLLALSLYQQDPSTYKWLHNMFNLPSTNVLERWLDTIARGNPTRVKQLMYYVYTRYCFRPRDDMVTVPGIVNW